MSSFAFRQYDDIALVREDDRLVAVAKRSGTDWFMTAHLSPVPYGSSPSPWEFEARSLEELMVRLEQRKARHLSCETDER
jgi:hypothetical protein